MADVLNATSKREKKNKPLNGDVHASTRTRIRSGEYIQGRADRMTHPLDKYSAVSLLPYAVTPVDEWVNAYAAYIDNIAHYHIKPPQYRHRATQIPI